MRTAKVRPVCCRMPAITSRARRAISLLPSEHGDANGRKDTGKGGEIGNKEFRLLAP